MDFLPIDVQDEGACYDFLLAFFHPHGLACPDCRIEDGLTIHRRHRAPVLDYRCGRCGRVFNAWTGTAMQGTHRRPGQLVRIVQGILQGTPTAQLARALGCSRRHLLDLRRRLEGVTGGIQPKPLADNTLGSDGLT